MGNPSPGSRARSPASASASGFVGALTPGTSHSYLAYLSCIRFTIIYIIYVLEIMNVFCGFWPPGQKSVNKIRKNPYPCASKVEPDPAKCDAIPCRNEARITVFALQVWQSGRDASHADWVPARKKCARWCRKSCGFACPNHTASCEQCIYDFRPLRSDKNDFIAGSPGALHRDHSISGRSSRFVGWALG